LPKVKAVAETIQAAHLPTRLETIDRTLWAPSTLRPVIARSDLVVDATGNNAYTDMLSRLCADAGRPLVAAALHRGGRVLRVRVQAPLPAKGISDRSVASGFFDVPADPAPSLPPIWEVGCGAPVNNAPPVAVVDAAARTARVVIDVLRGRLDRDVDVFEVYEAIEDPRFSEPRLFMIEATG
jgi:hypothetical protein